MMSIFRITERTRKIFRRSTRVFTLRGLTVGDFDIVTVSEHNILNYFLYSYSNRRSNKQLLFTIKWPQQKAIITSSITNT